MITFVFLTTTGRIIFSINYKYDINLLFQSVILAVLSFLFCAYFFNFGKSPIDNFEISTMSLSVLSLTSYFIYTALRARDMRQK